MRTLNGKIILSAISFLVLAFIAIKFTNNIQPIKNINPVTTKSISSISLSVKKISLDSKENVNEKTIVAPVLHGTEQENTIVKNWFTSHNYPYFQGKDDYASYDLVTAQKLANDGDVRAILRVAELTEKEHGLMSGIPILTDAAVYGSTWAISSIVSSIEISQYEKATTEDQKKAAFFEMVAWAKAAGMRGDGWPINLQIRFLMRYDHIAVSSDEEVSVNVRAQEIYDNLQHRRTELGLGNFDNSVPEAVLKYFDLEQRALEAP